MKENSDHEDDDDHLCSRCHSVIIGLQNYIDHRSSCTRNKEAPTEPSSSHQGTAADALASEARFLENIGLYLNPHPALGKSAASTTTGSTAAAPSNLLMSPRGQNFQDGYWDEILAIPLIPAAPQPSTSQKDDGDEGIIHSHGSKGKSLLSFLHKNRHLSSDGPTASSGENLTGQQQVDFLKQVNLEPDDGSASTSRNPVTSTTPSKWRLWNPENEGQGDHSTSAEATNNDDLWNDILTSAHNVWANDPVLVEVSANVPPPPQAPVATEPSLNENHEETTRRDAESPKYFCVACDRQISSKDAYQRHLLSELHFKRTAASSSTTFVSPRRKKARLSLDAEFKKASSVEDENVGDKVEASEAKTSPGDQELLTKKTLIKCQGCFSNVHKNFIGKHLVSHFHHHRSLNNPEQNRALVLENIHLIVKEMPFQCSSCRYYCNWNQDFLRHWKQEHNEELERDQEYWCSFCRVCFSSRSALAHFKSEGHREIVAVINRSVPIVIRRVSLHKCPEPDCGRSFRLKFSLKNHMKKAHNRLDFNLTDHSFHQCDLCSYKTMSSKTMRMHMFLAHPDLRKKNQKKYSCLVCHRQFSNFVSFRRHRKTKEHIANHRSRPRNFEEDDEAARNCHLCGLSIEIKDLSKKNLLDDHIWEQHADEVSACGYCGLSFPYPQQLTAHLKSKCRITKGGRFLNLNQGPFFCESCPNFATKSKAFLLYHLALAHDQPAENGDFKCPCCVGLVFKRASKLLHHLRTHDENQFRCSKCHSLFGNEASLKNHQTLCNSDSSETKKTRPTTVYACSAQGCKYVTKSKSALSSHRDVHKDLSYECDHCEFKCKRSSEMNRHLRQNHGSSVSFLSCQDCDYVTASSQHLKRHILAKHSTEKTTKFKCRHCSYSSLSLENLRKHVLNTKKHPGLKLYECTNSNDCHFATNSTLDYRCHLRTHFETEAVISEKVGQYFSK